MNMISIKAPQGSDEWKAERAAPNTFTASEAPVMMNASKHGDTRSDLIRQKFAGIEKEVTPFMQAKFDQGHAAEAAARPFVSASTGADLSPTTGYVVIDGMRILASFDGHDMLEDIIWENKLFNAALADQVRAGQLEPHYYWQLEQQLLVSGAKKAYFTTSDGTPENTVGMWYEAVPGRREKLIAGWKQFAKDLENYQHVEHAEKPAAQVSIELPALFVQAKGAITDSNMVAYGEALKARLAEVRAIQLVNDQDFSNAKAAASLFRDQIKKLKLAKESMLAQTMSIGEAARMIDAWSEDLRLTALQLEKDVEKADREKKAAIVSGARVKYADYIKALNERIGGNWMPSTTPDFVAAMKSKRTYGSMQDAVDTALANAKIEADGIADRFEFNRNAVIAAVMGNTPPETEWAQLFPDMHLIVLKEADDLSLLVKSRIDAHNKHLETLRLAAEANTAAAVEAERKAGEARAAAAIEAERMAEAKRVSEAAAYAVRKQHTDAALDHSKPAGDVIQPVSVAAAVPVQLDATDAAFIEGVIADFVRLLPLSPADKKIMRDNLPAYERYRTARLFNNVYAPAAEVIDGVAA